MNDFQYELESLINKHSQENGSNTPDFILAAYLNDCLQAFNTTVQNRETWHGRNTPATAVVSSPLPAEPPPPNLLEKAIAQTRDCERCAPLIADALKETP